MDVLVRGLDSALYRRLKAKAALMGYKVSAAIQEAIGGWLEESDTAVETEHDANSSTYGRMRSTLLEEHRGAYAVFHSGKFVGTATTLRDAGKLAHDAGAKKAVITKVGEEEPAGGEWLWSSIELSTV